MIRKLLNRILINKDCFKNNIIHEMGHIILCKVYNVKVDSVSFYHPLYYTSSARIKATYNDNLFQMIVILFGGYISQYMYGEKNINSSKSDFKKISELCNSYSDKIIKVVKKWSRGRNVIFPELLPTEIIEMKNEIMDRIELNDELIENDIFEIFLVSVLIEATNHLITNQYLITNAKNNISVDKISYENEEIDMLMCI